MDEIEGENCLDLLVQHFVKPTASDVILGGQRHPGTEFYHELLLKYAKRPPPPLNVTWNGNCATLRLVLDVVLHKAGPSRVESSAERIFVIVSDRGGRFLKRSGDQYEVLDKKDAVDKVNTALKKQVKAIHGGEILENANEKSSNVSTAQPQEQEHPHWTRSIKSSGLLHNHPPSYAARRRVTNQPTRSINKTPPKAVDNVPPEKVLKPGPGEVVIAFEPTDRDVISTKNRHWNMKHKGTIDYQRLVEQFARELPAMGHQDFNGRVHEYSNFIFDIVTKENGGRFLKTSSTQNPSRCILMSRQTALHKLTSGLRNKLVKLKPLTAQKYAANASTQAMSRARPKPQVPPRTVPSKLPETAPMTVAVMQGLMLPDRPNSTCRLHPVQAKRKKAKDPVDVVSTIHPHSGTLAYGKRLGQYAPLLPPSDDQDFSSRSVTSRKVRLKHPLDPESSGQGKTSVSKTRSRQKRKGPDLGIQTQASAVGEVDVGEASVGSADDNMPLAKKPRSKNGDRGTHQAYLLNAEGDEMTQASKHQRAERSRNHRRVTESYDGAAVVGRNLQDFPLLRVPWDVPRMVIADGEATCHDFGFMALHQRALTVKRRKKFVLSRSARFT